MKRYLLVLLILIVANAAVSELKSEKFFQELVANQLMFVKFYSPNCGHCVAMAPEYQSLSQRSTGKNYKIAKVDCTQNRELCVQLSVKGYPSLKLFASGTPFDYEGERTSDAMSAWLEEWTSKKLQLLSTEAIKSKIGKQTFVLVSGLSEKAQRVIAIASEYYDYNINYYAFKSSAFIKLYIKGTDKILQYTTDAEFPHSLINWALIQSRPIISDLSKSIISFAKQQKKFTYFLVVVNKNNQHSNLILSQATQWCNKTIKAIFCTSISKDNEIYEQIAPFAKITDETDLFIIKKDFKVGYHFSEKEISQQNLDKFYEEVKGDKIYRNIDAQRQIRERIKYRNVVKLTQFTYDTVVSENQFVFIEFYSPSCGHCVKYAEEYQKVATHFKDIQSKVVVAAIDVSQQQKLGKRFNVQGYPQFRLIVRKQIILYKKDRNMNAMIKFITDLTTSRFNKASIDVISARPFVQISGIDENSYLNALSGLFTTYPIYHTASEGNFSVKLHYEDKTNIYEGKQDFWDIADWLQIETSPVLSSLGVALPNKKIQKALIARAPILALLNKFQRSVAEPALKILEQYCTDKKGFVCGYIHSDEEDYQMLREWLGDKQYPENSIFWINNLQSIRYKYDGNLEDLTPEKLENFINRVKIGEVVPHKKREEQETKANDSNEQL